MNSSMAFLVGAATIAVASVPLILKIVPPNHIYGFQTPSTLANPTLWYRVNVFAGWALLIAAIASAVLVWCISSGALPPVAPLAVVFALPFAIAVVASFIYSYRMQSGVGGAINDRDALKRLH